MKFIFYILFLCFIANHSFAQDVVTLIEGEDVNLCGRILRIDGIYINNGNVKADISVLWQENSKPITGGYKRNDSIFVTEKCKYYVSSIKKFGMNDSKGSVVLSKEPTRIFSLDMVAGTMDMRNLYSFGEEEWRVIRISKDDADIKIAVKNSPAKKVTLKKNDLIWYGDIAFYISDFLASASDDPLFQWEIKLEQVKDYSYLNGPGIPGELINAPVDTEGLAQLVIRKMKYYPKEKFDQAEYDETPVKYWVLTVFMYHTGMAHQTMEIEYLGRKMNVEFEGYKSFDTEEEVMEFAKANNISDIKLEEK